MCGTVSSSALKAEKLERPLPLCFPPIFASRHPPCSPSNGQNVLACTLNLEEKLGAQTLTLRLFGSQARSPQQFEMLSKPRIRQSAWLGLPKLRHQSPRKKGRAEHFRGFAPHVSFRESAGHSTTPPVSFTVRNAAGQRHCPAHGAHARVNQVAAMPPAVLGRLVQAANPLQRALVVKEGNFVLVTKLKDVAPAPKHIL